MMILVGVLFTLGGFTMKYAQTSAQARLTITANELAAQRLDAVRSQPSYSAIALLAGTATAKADYTTYGVTTTVRRVGGAVTDSVDYQVVTVTITHPAMRKPVAKTTAIAAF